MRSRCCQDDFFTRTSERQDKRSEKETWIHEEDMQRRDGDTSKNGEMCRKLPQPSAPANREEETDGDTSRERIKNMDRHGQR